MDRLGLFFDLNKLRNIPAYYPSVDWGISGGDLVDFDDRNSISPAGQYEGGYAEAKMVRQPQIKDRIEMAVKQAEDRLAAVKRAREILDKNPELEELLNIMQRNNF